MVDFPAKDFKLEAKRLGQRRRKFLEHRDSWRLKSRALRLRKGNGNTKYFHQFTNHQKSMNTIWKVQKNNGDLVASFEDIAKTGVDHFSEIYREEI